MKNERAFQLWYYHVSHSHMLIRQPKNKENGYNTDYFFISVEYLNFPSILHNLVITQANEKQSKDFFSCLPIKNVKAYEYGAKLYILKCDEGIYHIVANYMKRLETQDDIMDIERYNPLKN